MQQAQALIAAHGGQKGTITIAILDVDDFKSINDTFAHDTGDIVLKNLTAIMTQNLRDTDIMGRYGGEEFILLLPNAKVNDVKMVFNRIQNALKQHVCEYEGNRINLPITISMGASIVREIICDVTDMEVTKFLGKIINKADKKVYKAKEMGKDQLKIAFL